MLTARQLADMAADVDAVNNSGTLDNPLVLMARHTRYLLDEVERLKQEAEPVYSSVDWMAARRAEMLKPEPAQPTGYIVTDKRTITLGYVTSLEDALRWYADESNYTNHGAPIAAPAAMDAGARARKALGDGG